MSKKQLNNPITIMKTPERFDNAIKALVQAFFDETLAKGNCAACAVGNMVASAWGQKVGSDLREVACGPINNSSWNNLFTTSDGVQFKGLSFINSDDDGELAIYPTGYSAEELAKVEYAFETNTSLEWRHYRVSHKSEIMEDQFKGLMAVVDVLCEIDNIDPVPYKKMFEYTEDFQPAN